MSYLLVLTLLGLSLDAQSIARNGRKPFNSEAGEDEINCPTDCFVSVGCNAEDARDNTASTFVKRPGRPFWASQYPG